MYVGMTNLVEQALFGQAYRNFRFSKITSNKTRLCLFSIKIHATFAGSDR